MSVEINKNPNLFVLEASAIWTYCIVSEEGADCILRPVVWQQQETPSIWMQRKVKEDHLIDSHDLSCSYCSFLSYEIIVHVANYRSCVLPNRLLVKGYVLSIRNQYYIELKELRGWCTDLSMFAFVSNRQRNDNY